MCSGANSRIKVSHFQYPINFNYKHHVSKSPPKDPCTIHPNHMSTTTCYTLQQPCMYPERYTVYTCYRHTGCSINETVLIISLKSTQNLSKPILNAHTSTYQNGHSEKYLSSPKTVNIRWHLFYIGHWQEAITTSVSWLKFFSLSPKKNHFWPTTVPTQANEMTVPSTHSN